MAEEAKIPALSEQYTLLKTDEAKSEDAANPPLPEVKATEDEKPAELTAKETVVTTDPAPEGGAEVATDEVPVAVPEDSEVEKKLPEEAAQEENPAPEIEDSATTENATAVEEGEAEEATPEIKLETAPADFRFPTTNQTRHCFTRYIEYHRCVAAKGEDAPECEKFAKYYRSLCPSEWVERWNEQRENGTFPGPL